MTRLYIPPTVNHFARSLGKGFSLAVSTSGAKCFLKCRHCSGRTLEPMIQSIDRAQELVEAVQEYPRMLLVSGGCDLCGRLLISSRALELIKLATRHGFRVAVHCGVAEWSRLAVLRDVGTDIAMMDLCLDELTLTRVRPSPLLHPESILNTIELAKRIGLRVVPHIVIGEDCGRSGPEYEAIEVLTTVSVDQVVIVVFTPLPDTPYQHCPPPPQSACISVLRYALTRLSTKVSLGCMRPREYIDLELYAIDSGIDAVANPSSKAVYEGCRRGLEILNLCCSYESLL